MPGAARLGDTHVCPLHGPGMVAGPGSTNVIVNSRQAARLSDLASCGAPIVMGEFEVLVSKFPCARIGDGTAHVGTITTGSGDVLVSVGGAGSGGGAPQAGGGGGARPPKEWTEEQGRALWTKQVEEDPTLPERWKQARAQDGSPADEGEQADPANEFSRFVMTWAAADPSQNIDQARALYAAFPRQYRLLDLHFPNGLPEPPSAPPAEDNNKVPTAEEPSENDKEDE
jgi:uncharacterized Zn-binding protein involved in type VI secretion